MKGQKTVGRILGETLRDYRIHFRVFLLTTLIVYGAAFLLQSVVNLLGFDNEGLLRYFHIDTDPRYATFDALQARTAVMVLSIAINTVLSLITYTLSVNAYDVMLRLKTGKEVSAKLVLNKFARNWARYLGISAWTMLWEALWFLVFIIPGVVKVIAYLPAPLLIVQYPDMTVRETLKTSVDITKGYKGKLFGLFMSVTFPYFILQIILSYSLGGQSWVYLAVSFALYLFIVGPIQYMMLTIAYLDIKQAAIGKRLLPYMEKTKGES